VKIETGIKYKTRNGKTVTLGSFITYSSGRVYKTDYRDDFRLWMSDGTEITLHPQFDIIGVA
jgi:hypothetical protein